MPAYAHVCALPDDAAVFELDQPEAQPQPVRRDALAWWTSQRSAGRVSNRSR